MKCKFICLVIVFVVVIADRFFLFWKMNDIMIVDTNNLKTAVAIPYFIFILFFFVQLITIMGSYIFVLCNLVGYLAL